MDTKKLLKYCGHNVTIWPQAKIVFPDKVSIGDESMIDDFTFVYGQGEGIIIGKFCHIAVGCLIQSGALITISDFSGIGAHSILLAASDDYHGNGFQGLGVFGDKYRKVTRKPVTLGRHSHIGVGTIVLPGVTIGEGCSVGAGSVVTRDLPEWTICIGSPCKPVKEKPREKQLQMEKEFLNEYYDKLSKT